MYLSRRAYKIRVKPIKTPKLTLSQEIDTLNDEQIREINQQMVHYQIKPKKTFPSEARLILVILEHL